MDGDVEVAAAATANTIPPLQSALRRRAVAIPTKLSVSLPSTCTNGFSAAGQPHHHNEFVLTETSSAASKGCSSLTYTSLKDLLPPFSFAAINSPTAASSSAGRSCYEISIRNPLVKQAAWAYLQPMSASPGSSGPSFIHRLWLRLCSPVNSCLNLIGHHVISCIVRAFHQILRAILRCSTR